MGKNYEKDIKELISKMTITEKVGQLRQCGPSLVGAFDVSFEELLDMMFDGRISKEEFDRLMGTTKQDFREDDLRAGKIGSYNGISDAATANMLQKIAVEETRLGIPLIFGYDVLHGYKTVSPIPLGESCAWDTDLWEKTAKMAAKEATAGGVHMTFAPMVDVSKDARWGRVSEGAGEDVLLNSLYGAAKVKGFQGDDLKANDSMVACVKHFAAYGAGEAGRDYNRVDMSLQRLREEYLPPYKACIDAGARAIMPAFNDINGVPCSVNSWLLRDVLRKEWGFDGMTVSDANAIAECVNHGIARDRSEAAKLAIDAGMDMDMTSDAFFENIEKLVNDGIVKEDILNEAVANILRVKYEIGLFDNPYKTDEDRESHEMLRDEYRTLVREAAVKSIVLLKNSVLPLKDDTKIAVFGELASSKEQMVGAWSIGADTEACISLNMALDTKKASYIYENGIKDGEVDKDAIDRAVSQSQVIIYTMGETKEESGEAASKADITLPNQQIDLFNALVNTGKPVVIILFNGRPLAIPHIADKASAIIEAWHLGTEAGNALVDILYGKENPSGKLTTSFPYTSGQCPMYYAHPNTGRPGGKSKFTSKYLDTPLEPVYPFGYGLSYTEFDYSDFSIEQIENKIHVSVTVKNIGDRAGDEVVQCYMQDITAKRVRPVKQLKAFEKISLKSGEEKQVIFKIPVCEMGYYDWNMNYVVDDGEYKFFVGGNSRDTLSEVIILQ